jgi:branched-chain amino acid transport system substrate-binding protein
MQFTKLVAATAVAAFFAGAPGGATAQTVKIGFVTSFSGQNASVGEMMDQTVKLWTKEHAKDLPPGVKVEIIRRDDTGPNPEVAKRIATELMTRDKVDFITGVIWTPNAFAIGPLTAESKTPFIIMNAGTSAITTTSPYVARVSFTLWQSCLPLGQWAAKNGIKTAYIAVSDFGPGHDAQEAFTKGFTEAGGKVVEAVRMPISTQDFATFMQKAKDAKPDALFSFVPAGVQATGLLKAFRDTGLGQAGIKLIGPGDITTDEELPNMGDVALGAITMHHYSAGATRPANQEFVKLWKRDYGANSTPAFPAVGAWDAMAAIYDAIKAQNGKMSGEKSMEILRGWKNENSPRGPVMIDPETRDVVQNEYMRRVEKVNGVLTNVEFDTITMVKDPWKVINNKK